LGRDEFNTEAMKPKPSRASSELLANLSNQDLIKYTGCHFTTVYRWRRQKQLPPHIEKLLKFVALKELDQFLGWEGWKIVNKKLISPSGGNYDPGEVDAIQIRRQELAFYAAERRNFINTPNQPSINDVTDEFLRVNSKKIMMRFTPIPHPVELDEFEYGGPERIEIDEYLDHGKTKTHAAARRAALALARTLSLPSRSRDK
jgi:hypothetical protein